MTYKTTHKPTNYFFCTDLLFNTDIIAFSGLSGSMDEDFFTESQL